MVTTLSWAIEATTLRVMIVASVWCAQLYAQHMTYHPQSSVHPRTLLLVPVQQLTLNATCKCVAHTIADGGRVVADAAKLLRCVRHLQWFILSRSTRKPVAGAIQRSQNGREILVPERRDICADVEKEGTFEQNGGLRRGCHQRRMPDGTSGRSQERVCMGRRAIFRPGTAASPAAWLSIAFGISCITVFVSKILVEHCPLPVRRVRTVEDKRSASGGTFSRDLWPRYAALSGAHGRLC